MELEKPYLAYVSPLPPKQGGFYYREQHMNALKRYFNISSEDRSSFSIKDIFALIFFVVLSPVLLPFFRLLKFFSNSCRYYEYDFGAYKTDLTFFPFVVLDRLSGVKTVFRLHEDYTNKSYGWMLSFWDNFWLRIAANKIIVHTEEHKKMLWPSNRMKTEVMLSGIDVVKRKRNPEKNTIIIPGFISEWKGHDILIKALAEVKKSIPDVKLIIAGKKHDSKFFQKIENEILINDLQDNIELHTEYLKRSDMQKLLKRATIAVLPYRRITFSAALCDCIDWEIPTITSDIPEFYELAPDLPKFHLNYFLNDEEYALAEKIVYLLKDKKHYDKTLDRMLSLKHNYYNWNNIVKEEAKMIYSLL